MGIYTFPPFFLEAAKELGKLRIEDLFWIGFVGGGISLLFALTFAFGQTIMTVCLAALVDKVVGAENTGKMIGVFSAVATIGTLLSSFAIPMLFDRSGSYRLPLMLASCCAAMGFICLWIAMKTKKDK